MYALRPIRDDLRHILILLGGGEAGQDLESTLALRAVLSQAHGLHQQLDHLRRFGGTVVANTLTLDQRTVITARQWTGSIENGWREVYDIDPSIVTEAAEKLESARAFLKGEVGA